MLPHATKTALAALALLASAAAASAAPLLTNGSFESPALGATAYVYPGGLSASWNYGGSALVNTSVGANAWYGASAPAGYDLAQFAALQGTSTLSQIFNAPSVGAASISWLSGGRPDFGSYAGDQTYDVLLNGNLLGSYFTTSGQAFASLFANGSLLAGANTLSFVGTDLSRGGDQTAFIDNVSVTALTAAPEPITFSLFGAGLVGLVAMRRRKKATQA